MCQFQDPVRDTVASLIQKYGGTNSQEEQKKTTPQCHEDWW